MVLASMFFFVWHARYTRAVWRKAHKAKKENTEGKWPLWVEGVVKELFETMQPSTEDLAKSWGLPDPHLKLKLKLKRYSIYFHANLVTQFLKKKKNRNNFQPCVFSRAKNTSILGRSFRKRRRITAGWDWSKARWSCTGLGFSVDQVWINSFLIRTLMLFCTDVCDFFAGCQGETTTSSRQPFRKSCWDFGRRTRHVNWGERAGEVTQSMWMLLQTVVRDQLLTLTKTLFPCWVNFYGQAKLLRQMLLECTYMEKRRHCIVNMSLLESFFQNGQQKSVYACKSFHRNSSTFLRWALGLHLQSLQLKPLFLQSRHVWRTAFIRGFHSSHASACKVWWDMIPSKDKTSM